MRAIIVLFLLLCSWPALAAQRYVANGGVDTGTCITQGSPCLTITFAYNLSGPGDTINVAPGVYTDYTAGWGIKITTSGSAGNPITLKSTKRWQAIVDGAGQVADRLACFYVYATSYITIDGFIMQNCYRCGVCISNDGVTDSTNITIINNEIRFVQGPNDATSGHGGQGIGESTSAATVCNNNFSNNYIHDVGSAWEDGLDHGLYVGCTGEIIANNISVNNQHGAGLQLSAAFNINNAVVYNNTFSYNSSNGIVIWAHGGVFTNLTVDNNITVNNNRGLVGCQPAGTGITLSNNISFNNASTNYNQDYCGGGTATFTNTGMVTANPQFVNPTAFDYRIKQNSPGKGGGITHASVATDYSGAARAAPYSIGAYQNPMANALLTLRSGN